MLYTQSVVLFASKNESNILWGIGDENIYFFDFRLSLTCASAQDVSRVWVPAANTFPFSGSESTALLGIQLSNSHGGHQLDYQYSN